MRTPWVLVFALIASLRSPDAQAQTTITRCGIKLTLPKTWVVGTLSPDDQCHFGLRPKNWSTVRKKTSFALPDYPIVITVIEGPFEDAAVDAGFLSVAEVRRRQGNPTLCEDLPPDRWLIMGGKGSRLCGEADELNVGDVKGIGGCTSYGRMRKGTGEYAGLGEGCAVAVSLGSTNLSVEATEVDYDGIVVPLVQSAKVAK